MLVPLFSIPSSVSWGIGDILDVPFFAGWLAGSGQRVLQLLPINEIALDEQSPYSALSAMAIDPIFISIPAVPEFAGLGGEGAMDRVDRDGLAYVRDSPRIEYVEVRRLKRRALEEAFGRFFAADWQRDSSRARDLKRFVSEHKWWLDDYTLFRAIHAAERERPWLEWPEQLKRHDEAALAEARVDLARDILFQQYLQWIADAQWRDVKGRVGPLEVFGDFPFMVSLDSADVWARQDEFRLDASVGAPPDAFSASGQDWGTPLCRWEVMASDGFSWLQERARRAASLYDGFRVDHVVGLFRTYARPRGGGAGFFTPSEEPAQRALGEAVLAVVGAAGAEIIAEDLGTIPDFVRQSLEDLSVPGFCVLRWERLWDSAGEPFRDPVDYPVRSVATSGTHDTEPLLVWWDSASDDEREKVEAIPTLQRLTGGAGVCDRLPGEVRDALLELLFTSGSDLLLVPIQDAFGWRDRINDPATMSPVNWTFRLPWPSDQLDAVPEARECQDRLRRWAIRHGRR